MCASIVKVKQPKQRLIALAALLFPVGLKIHRIAFALTFVWYSLITICKLQEKDCGVGKALQVSSF
jgi:uncharacterized protein with GYD domain